MRSSFYCSNVLNLVRVSGNSGGGAGKVMHIDIAEYNDASNTADLVTLNNFIPTLLYKLVNKT